MSSVSIRKHGPIANERARGREPIASERAKGREPIANEKTKKAGRFSVVSRAENKIAGAVKAFRFHFDGKVVLDIGSSTGGFTEYALLDGAKKVIAVEKGTRQMKAPLRFDERVELHEKTDIFTVKVTEKDKDAAELAKARDEVWIEKPDIIVADVSFVSLKRVLAYAKVNIADSSTEFLVMLKPQFEAVSRQLNHGIVKNEKVRREIIREFEWWLRKNDFIVKGKRDNEIAGKNGNIERFYWLKLAD